MRTAHQRSHRILVGVIDGRANRLVEVENLFLWLDCGCGCFRWSGCSLYFLQEPRERARAVSLPVRGANVRWDRYLRKFNCWLTMQSRQPFHLFLFFTGSKCCLESYDLVQAALLLNPTLQITTTRKIDSLLIKSAALCFCCRANFVAGRRHVVVQYHFHRLRHPLPRDIWQSP